MEEPIPRPSFTRRSATFRTYRQQIRDYENQFFEKEMKKQMFKLGIVGSLMMGCIMLARNSLNEYTKAEYKYNMQVMIPLLISFGGTTIIFMLKNESVERDGCFNQFRKYAFITIRIICLIVTHICSFYILIVVFKETWNFSSNVKWTAKD